MELDLECENYDIDLLPDKFLVSETDFRILHVNIRSLRKNYDKLLALLNILPFPLHAICLSETFLYENEHSCFPLPNYLFLGNSRDTKQGGAGIYVHSGLAIEEQSVNLEGAEAVSVRLSGAVVRPFYLTCVYRTGAADLGKFLNSLDSFLHSIDIADHILTGDINIDLLRSDSSEYYSDIISQYNYQNIITIPTRICSTTETCIDHMLVNFNSCKIYSGTLCSDISDHLPIFAIFENLAKPSSNILQTRNLNISEQALGKIFENVSWDSITCESDANAAYDKFLQIFTRKFDEACPLVEKSQKVRFEKFETPWFNNKLSKETKKRDKLLRDHLKYPFSPKLRLAYQKQRNYVTSLLRDTKASYYDNLISGISDSKQLWNTINTAIGRKNAINPKTGLNSLQLDESSPPITNSLGIAEALNSYFTSIGPCLAAKLSYEPFESEITHNLKPESSFQLNEVDESVIYKELAQLNVNKAAGPDEIPAKFIKLCGQFILKPFTHVVNLSLKYSIVPTEMKKARVRALYKNKGSKLLPNNYRPISILPVFSKILEKIVNFQLQNFLNVNNVIFPNQYGFQQKKGTADALIQFTNKCFKALNDSECVLGIFIDFSKAFDTVDHTILISKLRNFYDFSDSAVSWFSDYLENREQFVQIDSVKSAPQNIKCGVPQGSILGPTLFILYINDLMLHTNFFEPILFADDTNLFVKSKNLNCLSSEVNENLDAVFKWCNANKLTLNVEKTNIILMKNHQNKFRLENEITMNSAVLRCVDEIKFLGVTINPTLNWEPHLSKLRKDLNKISGLLFVASRFLPKSALILIYNALAHSKLVYCIEAWGNAPATHLKKVFVIQKRMVRTIFKRKPREHSAPYFQNANILPVPQLYTHRICLYAHHTFYQTIIPTRPYDTRRSTLDLPLPPSTSTIGHRQPSYQASAAWNQLPAEIRVIKNTNTFKAVLKQHLLSTLV